MQPYLLTSLSLLLLASLTAQEAKPTQNLVNNYSFEETAADSIIFFETNDIATAKGWSNPNEATPKIYSTNSRGNVYDEYGSAWPFKARSGINVAAINVYGGTDQAPLRDYVQGSLREPLTVGQSYEFSFWVHYHCEGANNIGIVFLPQPIQLSGDGLIDLEPAAHQLEVTPYSRSKIWTRVAGTFVAYQPYTRFLAGNFFSNAATKLESDRYNHHFAYIDDIVVRPLEEPVVEVANDTLTTLKARQWEENIEKLNEAGATLLAFDKASFTVANFAQDGAAIPSASHKLLDQVVDLLRADASKKVLIQGFASSEGSPATNLRIAARRCQAVASYLQAKGVDEAQIRTEALGEQKPVAKNNTPAGRRQNRRVELRIE